MIDTALAVSGQEKLYYLAHSQGTMIAFIQFGLDKALASKIHHFYALGPVATVAHIKGLLRLVAPFTREIQWFFRVFGVRDFLPNNWVINMLARTVCTEYYTNPLCKNVIFVIAGYDSNQMNTTRIPVYITHTPSGTSAQNFAHFGQLVEAGKFQKFDYGAAKNKQIYGTETPTVYDVSKMEVPVTMYWGEQDWLADGQDIKETILPALPNIEKVVELKETNHLDLIWGMRVPNECYKPIIQDMLMKESSRSRHS